MHADEEEGPQREAEREPASQRVRRDGGVPAVMAGVELVQGLQLLPQRLLEGFLAGQVRAVEGGDEGGEPVGPDRELRDEVAQVPGEVDGCRRGRHGRIPPEAVLLSLQAERAATQV